MGVGVGVTALASLGSAIQHVHQLLKLYTIILALLWETSISNYDMFLTIIAYLNQYYHMLRVRHQNFHLHSCGNLYQHSLTDNFIYLATQMSLNSSQSKIQFHHNCY